MGATGLFAGFLSTARNGRGLLFHITALTPGPARLQHLDDAGQVRPLHPRRHTGPHGVVKHGAPDRIAMRCPGSRGPGGFARHDLTLSYRELDQRSDAIAAGLAPTLAPHLQFELKLIQPRRWQWC